MTGRVGGSVSTTVMSYYNIYDVHRDDVATRKLRDWNWSPPVAKSARAAVIAKGRATRGPRVVFFSNPRSPVYCPRNGARPGERHPCSHIAHMTFSMTMIIITIYFLFTRELIKRKICASFNSKNTAKTRVIVSRKNLGLLFIFSVNRTYCD